MRASKGVGVELLSLPGYSPINLLIILTHHKVHEPKGE